MCDPACPLHNRSSLHCCLDDIRYAKERLERRERELMSSYGREWAVILPEAMVSHWSPHNEKPYFVLPGEKFVNIEFTRGFISEVRCDASSWLAHGKEIVRRQPVEKVVLVRHKPQYRATIGYIWFNESREQPRSHVVAEANIPTVLFDALEHEHVRSHAGRWKAYSTEQAALDALSAASLLWARTKEAK